MSETAAFMALVETASLEGIVNRQKYLKIHGPQDLGWSYANILDVAAKLTRQLQRKGFFRIYIYVSNNDDTVRYCMYVTDLMTYEKPVLFDDPVDGRQYLVHSRMKIKSISELEPPMALGEFTSVDRRKPDLRHLQLGFLFVVDPEV